MPTTTAVNAIPLPLLTDPTAPDIPSDLAGMAAAIDTRLVGRFATTAALGTAIPSPTDGMVAYVTGIGWVGRDGSVWVPLNSGLQHQATPGSSVRGQANVRTTVTAGPTDVVASPASGRRIVKGLALNVATAGNAVTVSLGATAIMRLPFTLAASVLDLGLTLPLTSSETLKVTSASGTVQVEAGYVDRGDALIDRLGLQSSTSGGTVVASSGSARTISQIIVANTSSSTSATYTLTVAGTDLMTTAALSPSTLLMFDRARDLPAGQTVATTITGGGTVATVVIGF